MACKSDGRARGGISYSSMKQPPLIKQLRGILSEYPDGGQILQELIQNAEDAEASEFRVMYDERRINEQTKGKALKFTKFFRGPALCIYNDAVFSDKDWEGIQMVYSSVKEEDPLKVGRFGLGFKSVFHITDYPCIVSGKHVLLIDPQQPSDMVNAKVKLKDIQSLAEDGLVSAEFWKAFKDMFDFSKDTVKRGHYRGTIMRFPLREQKSKLSDVLYTPEKVMTLFDSFRAESSSILIFLKSLESISLCIYDKDSHLSEVMKVKIQDRNGKIKEQRNKFREDIKTVNLATNKKDIKCKLRLTIDVTEGAKHSNTEWLVVNYFVAEDVSPEFERLIGDRSLGYSPTVGVAKPLNLGADAFEGHVFCFLPLPRDGATLTGLPIHVNGYFALSQNRHHLKWETDEQHGKTIDDKAILWNKLLLSEALPRAYEALIQAAIKWSEKNGNNSASVTTVYQCLPLSKNTKRRWSDLEKALYQRLNCRKCVYQNDKDTWISFNDACFATFSNTTTKTDVQKSVIKCLKIIGSKYVDIPDSVFLTLKGHVASVHDLSTDSLAKLLRENARYKTVPSRNKAGIISYLFSDKASYTLVYGLELLPLHSGRWATFEAKAEKVYMCSSKQIEILPGHDGKLMLNGPMLGESLTNHLKYIAEQGLYQLHIMDMNTLKVLLQDTLTIYMKETASKLVSLLKNVWRYITKEDAFTHFRDIRIFPLLKKGTWKEPQSIELVKCSDRLLVQVHGKAKLSDGVCRCFQNMGITIVHNVPEWIPKDVVKSQLYRPTQKDVVSLLGVVGSDENRQDMVTDFNETCKWEDKQILLSYLSGASIVLTDKAVQFLKEVHLFKAFRSKNDTGYETSVSETKVHINQTDDFPNHVFYPFACVSVDSRKEFLLKTLGSHQVTLTELVLEKLKRLRTEPDSSDIPAFMEYLMDRFHTFQTNKDVVDCASEIPFVKAGSRLYKPGDLFDPYEPSLQSLLQDEHLLPDRTDSERIYCLKRLGLKDEEDVDANIALQVAQTLDKASYEKEKNKMIKNKAAELMSLFKRRPKLLADKCSNGSTLADSLQNLHFMIVQANRTQSYPDCVEWFSHSNLLCKPSEAKDVSLCFLTGAVMPTVVCPREISTFFGVMTLPCVTIVLRQLQAIKDSCPLDSSSDIVQMLKQVYNFLDDRKDEIKANIDIFANKMITWTGDAFVTADKVWVKRTDEDVNLKPYFFKLHKEFRDIESLFLLMGCKPLQDAQVLLDTLHMIATTHRRKQRLEKVKRDRITTRNILERLATFVKYEENKSWFEESGVLMMVRDKSSRTLKLLPVEQCVYEDDPGYFYEKDDDLEFVHEMVPPETAKTLGVKSLSMRALQNAEEIGVQEWGQNEKLTTRIKSLLDEGYTDGMSVPKELIQNADDAGASSVKFLYDERQNMKARKRVFSKDMEHFQGPALWIYNNALFTDEDLLNITKLNEGTKQNDVRKIGKFGLGFNAVYNLTDLPSFFSGRNIVFFDPHEKHFTNILGRRSKGLKYQLPNKTLVSRYIDQFQPYDGIFGCDVAENKCSHYNGTLFRLPLRTEQQASQSQISTKAYTKIEMQKLLEMFIKAAGNFLLFSQNVNSIEIHHISANAKNASEQKLLYELRKDSLRLVNGVPKPITESLLTRIQDIMRNSTLFTEIHQTVFKQTVPDYTKRVIRGLSEMSKKSETTWLTAWATGKGNNVSKQKELTIQTSVPLCAVAVPLEKGSCNSFDLKRVPLGFYKEGHVFCFLPLPLKTKLPVHINGCFSVTSSRRQLASLNEDDKDGEKSAWNSSLLDSVLVFAQMNLLRALVDNNLSQRTNYDLWPQKCEPFVRPFLESFYRHIIGSNAVIFKGNNSWVGFQDVTFLDPKISSSAIGQIAFAMLEQYPPRDGKTLIDMPLQIFECMTSSNKENIYIIEEAVIDECELFSHFLRNIQVPFWNKRLSDRNKLIVAALKFKNDTVRHKMQVIECIPTSPRNRLSKASNLVHPRSPLACLFERDEERFPLDKGGFQDQVVLQTIVSIGMNEHSLPADILLNRCDSIHELATRCCRCALDRSINVLKYMYTDHATDTLNSEEHIIESIENSWMLPVLQKPKSWPFSWKGSTRNPCLKRFEGNTSRCSNKLHRTAKTNLVLGRPKDLLRERSKMYIGSVSLVLDENILENDQDRFTKLFQLMGIKDKDELSLKLFVEQLLTMSKEFKNKTSSLKDVSKIYEVIFSYLNSVVESRESKRYTQELDTLRSTAVILIGSTFVHPSKVAFNVNEECRPHLYRLPEQQQLTKRSIHEYLGVKNYFGIEDILDVMDIMCQRGQKVSNIEAVNHLLKNIHAVMERQGIDYDGIAKWHDRIVAPDVKCVCWPTHELVFENKVFETSTSMKVMHRSIAPQLGMDLGVKSKQLRCFEDISIGISFGQQERLVTRIKGLLKAYPCGASIMKELLQNADDAGATEIHFVKDYRYHSKERIFQKSSEPLQGPSLCVFNNSYFTQEDIEGIHRLGQGSKSADPTKTGQYGVGFNAVYHLTDTPSFITKAPQIENGGHLIILDPLCSHVPKATQIEPGMMCTIDDIQNFFCDHLLGFSVNELIQGDVGTVFRFPLRLQQSDISNETVNTEKVDNILKEFEKDMFESVLFLKNITCIKISNITSGSLEEEYTVNVQLSREARNKRASFTTDVKSKTNTSHKDKNLDISPVESIYHMTVGDSCGTSENWIIVQRFGIDKTTENLEEIKERLRCGDLGLLPVGGVAFPVNKCLLMKRFKWNEFLSCAPHIGMFPSDIPGQAVKPVSQRVSHKTTTFKGKAFCFLPLPIQTGLPLHVHAHFALDHEARRELWKEGYRHAWNCCLSEALIVPALISGLHYIAGLIKSAIGRSLSSDMVNAVLNNYHFYFPTPESKRTGIWTYIFNTFYNRIVDQREDLFPYVFDKKSEISPPAGIFDRTSGRFRALFTCIENNIEQYRYGVFNSIESHLSTNKHRDDEADLLQKLLLSFGMKLLVTPDSVRETIIAAGITNIPTASPSLVLSFMKSYNDRSCCYCDVGGINKAIGETKYRKSENLFTVIKYMLLEQTFYEKVEGLPTLLAADGIVKQFSKQTPAFLTEYAALLPGSEKDFVHADILMAFSNGRPFQSGCFKRFLFDDFVRLLPISFDINKHTRTNSISGQDDNSNQGVISSEWLCMFYDFLSACSFHDEPGNSDTFQTVSDQLTASVMGPSIDVQKVKRHLNALKDWHFLPSVESNTRRIRIPLRESVNLLYLNYDQKQDSFGKTLESLRIPTLDMHAFDKCKLNEVVKSTMEKCVASPYRPLELLQCLVHHRDVISSCNSLSCEGANSVLAFFGRNLTVMAQQTGQDNLKRTLRNLPLFVTQEGRLLDLPENCEVFVLSKEMPLGGIRQWAHECKTILLRKNDALESLHQYLGLKNTDIGFVYAIKILPQFHAIPKKHWMSHINYIREILADTKIAKEIQEKITSELTQIPFINSKGVKKRANELYDPGNPVFQQMKDKNDFPPKTMGNEWLSFLRRLGMVTDIDDKMLIEFARQIEIESINHQTDVVRKKARTLFQRFVEYKGSDWNTETLSQVCTVRFIEPVILDGEAVSICQQNDNAGRFVCFKGAVSCLQWELCWTSLSLLPEKVTTLQGSVRYQLGIHESPPIESVLLHCQNVVDALKEKITNATFVKQQMTTFYDFLSDKTSSTSASVIKNRLEHKPFVHLPEDNRMVRTCDIIIDLDPTLEIKPYLFRAPKYYGRYHNLFEFIGSKSKIMFSHYAVILGTLKAKCKDNQMHPAEKTIAQCAISGLVNIKAEADQSIETVKTVYLPNVDLQLVDSKTIVLSNSESYEQRLRGNIQLDIFAGNAFLDLKENCNFEEIFSKWPAHLKPKFLTHIVSEDLNLCSGNEGDAESSEKATTIAQFLHSPELATALCRLIKYQFFRGTKRIKYDAKYFETEIQTHLQRTRVVEMQSLRTVLKYSGKHVSGSEIELPYYIKKGIDAETSNFCTFYFKDISRDQIDDVSFVVPGLLELVQLCAVGLESVGYVTSLLTTIEDPTKIPYMLDHFNIQPYDHILTPKREYFPKPGTYVEEKFHPFLEQSITPFREYEFNDIAMELEEIESDIDSDGDPVYIYVKIVKELKVPNICSDLRRIYLVNTGNQDLSSERVPIYRLYRFVRKESEAGNELQRYDIEPIHSRTFDENCLRIKRDLEDAWTLTELDRKRIVRRMLLKWHPDKNQGDGEYSKEVFLFIKIVLSRLENEERITENVKNEMRKGRSNVSSSSSKYYEKVNRRANVYARSYHKNHGVYNRSEGTGRYAHRSATKIKHPDLVEANRWLRQAKNDVRAAEAMLESVDSVDGHNWICYTCHQACEKALKSERYSQDANDVPRGRHSHNLQSLTSDPEMKEQVRLLEERLGNHARLRYPDAVSRPQIPSDIFNKEDAEFAIRIARRIVAMVDDNIS